jgi:hypothetical protein
VVHHQDQDRRPTSIGGCMSEILPREPHATTSRSTTRCIEVVGNGSGVQTDRTSALSAAQGVGGEEAQEAAAGQNRRRVEFGLRDSGCKGFEPTVKDRLWVRQRNAVQVGEGGLDRALTGREPASATVISSVRAARSRSQLGAGTTSTRLTALVAAEAFGQNRGASWRSMSWIRSIACTAVVGPCTGDSDSERSAMSTSFAGC